MRTLLILCLLLFPALAWPCMNQIAESEIPKAIALTPGAGAKACGPSDPCICFDGIDWETAVYSDVLEDDFSKPIHQESNVRECQDEETCVDLIADGCKSPKENGLCDREDEVRYCDSDASPSWRAVAAGFEAYCKRVTGYEQKSVKRLKTDAAKVAAKQARLATEAQAKAQADAEKAARLAKLQSTNVDSASTVTALRAIVKDMLAELLAR